MSKQSIIICACLLACGGVHAASADMSVDVTIQPEACALMVTDGGKVSYGNLSATTVKDFALWNGTHYSLPTKSIAFTVNCSSPQIVSFLAADNRISSKETGLANPELKYGLGMSGMQKIGFFEVKATSVKRDGGGFSQPMDGRLIRYPGGEWQPKDENRLNLSPSFESTFTFYAADQSVYYSAFWSGTLEFATMVAKKVVDQASSEVQLDGAMTLSLLYP